ncbi:MAG TPA: hypothetical protein PLD62_09460 [Candidatus Cloacimonadota bacterium]|nr:hypothetical protein [Candidatus Cloacimonadota bacterium]
MQNKLIIVIGAYGSGKSEYSINLAQDYRAAGEEVILVDLDVVNPYFRSRDMQERFAAEGIDVVAPEGEYKHADLPMLSPRIMGAVQNLESTVILDVGGDPAGCRTLARYVENIRLRGYEMHLVINTKRPFTADKNEIITMLQMLEGSSNLRITEFICNTNLMEFTDAKIVENGIAIIEEVAREKRIKFEKYLVLQTYDDIVPDHLHGKQKHVLKYYLSKPWEMTHKVHIRGI